MDNNGFEKKMRAMEYFHNLRLLPGAWVVIRLDGRGFSSFTETRFDKPFDLKFHELMVQTTKVLLELSWKILGVAQPHPNFSATSGDLCLYRKR